MSTPQLPGSARPLAAPPLARPGNGLGVAALVLGVAFLGCALAFLWKRSIGAARRLFLVSVIYLPLLLGLMVFDR